MRSRTVAVLLATMLVATTLAEAQGGDLGAGRRAVAWEAAWAVAGEAEGWGDRGVLGASGLIPCSLPDHPRPTR